MKICAVCNKIQRNPQFCGTMGLNKVVLCEEHKSATEEEIKANMTAQLPGMSGIETWDYLWQGAGRT